MQLLSRSLAEQYIVTEPVLGQYLLIVVQFVLFHLSHSRNVPDSMSGTQILNIFIYNIVLNSMFSPYDLILGNERFVPLTVNGVTVIAVSVPVKTCLLPL